ncbi:MAG TPA: hypothetical protein VJU15_02700, partial [Gemmatimonadales bacterium]|nr:hypothetical protein [Gemmatimonadales bacterium]
QSEPWAVQGRFNHYRFDMNRDFLAQSQLETRALAGLMRKYRPQLVVDLHSTVSQYFFPPTAAPMNINLGPWQSKWEEKFGRANAAAFDRHGWQYYVRDVFDYFYPGYVDLWPSLTGATGMTFETDGGPEIRLRKEDGSVTTFTDGIAHHFTASLATLGALAAGREDRLKDYYDFHASGMSEARTRSFKRVVIAPTGDPDRALRVVTLLRNAGIEVQRTSTAFTSATAHDYMAATTGRRTFPPGSWVIDLAQPEARLATALLEPRAMLDSMFIRKQLDRFERNRRRGEEATREFYEFYDITAWSLLYTFGLDAAWTEDVVAVQGDAVGDAPERAAGSVSARAQSGYVFPGGREASARLAMYLLREGFRVVASTTTLMADGTHWAAGTYIARVQRNPATLHDRIRELATRTGAQVTAVRSAFPDSGMGIGSEQTTALKTPKVLLAAGDGVSQTSFGDVWYYMEREIEYPLVPVDLSRLGVVNLWDYNVLILPEGSGGTMLRRLGSADRIKRWVQEGGSIIAFGPAISLLTSKDVALSTVGIVGEGDSAKPARATKDSTPADTTLSASARPGPPLVSATAPGQGRPEGLPGLIARGTLDRSHWLTYGYERDQLPVQVSNDFLVASKKGDNPVSFVGKDLVLAGFAWPNNTERLLAGTAWAVVENVGQGKVILFADNPLFRGFWRGTANLFLNALLFGPGR